MVSFIEEMCNWKDVEMLVDGIANNIKKLEQQPTVIVGVSRGGLIPARLLANKLKIKRIYSFGVESYVDQQQTELHIYQDFYNYLIANFHQQTVLVVDDIADTGKTLSLIKSRLDELHAGKIYTCSLHYKPISEHKPDFYGKEVDPKLWIRYQWEDEE